MLSKKLILVLVIPLGVVLSLHSSSTGPNISGKYKITSVMDGLLLSRYLRKGIIPSQHANKDSCTAELCQIWNLNITQNTNGTASYLIYMEDEAFTQIPVIEGGNGIHQQWHLEPIGMRNLWIFFANGTDNCLTNNGPEKIVSLSTNKCLNTTSQLWSLYNLDSSQTQDYSGVYYIQSQLNGKYVSGVLSSNKRLMLNHLRNNKTMPQEWKISRRYEYGHCYEIKLLGHNNQIIPLGNSSNVVDRLPLVWQFDSVGQARWKIRQLNTDNCLGFVDGSPSHREDLEVHSSLCERSDLRQIWFLIQLTNFDNLKDGKRKCTALTALESTAQQNTLQKIYLIPIFISVFQMLVKFQ